MAIEREIESPNSSSNIVVRGNEHGIEITLDPMNNPIRRLDVYPEDAEGFVDAVIEAAEEVSGYSEPADYELPNLEQRVRLLRDYCELVATDPHNRSGILGHPDDIERMNRDMSIAAQYLDLVLWEPDGEPEFSDPAARWEEMAEQIDEWSNDSNV